MGSDPPDFFRCFSHGRCLRRHRGGCAVESSPSPQQVVRCHSVVSADVTTPMSLLAAPLTEPPLIDAAGGWEDPEAWSQVETQ